MKNCKNCGLEFSGKFCQHCGQKEFNDTDKSVKKIVAEALEFFTNFDNSFFKTINTIFWKPGQLSIDFCSGKQKSYFRPISLFFFVVVLYLFFPVANGLNTELKYYKGTKFYGKIIENQINRELEIRNITFESLSEEFKAKSGVTSKIALFLFIPISVLIIYLLYFKRKRLLYDNVILATEINIFYILGLFIITPLLFFGLSTILVKLMNLRFNFFDDNFGTLIIFIFFSLFVVILFRRLFEEKWWITISKGLTFVFLHAIFLTGLYRFLVFKMVLLQL